jgi:hypothetical protein
VLVEGDSMEFSCEGHEVYYKSRKLKEREGKYSTHDLETFAVVQSLKMWRHYLLGKRFKLRIDCHGLKYLFDQSNLNSMQD